MRTPSQYVRCRVPATVADRRVLAVKAATVLVVMLAVLLHFSIGVRLAYHDMPGVPVPSSLKALVIQFGISLAIPCLAFATAVIRHNVLDDYSEGRFERVGGALLLTPVSVFLGVVVCGLVTELTPAPEAPVTWGMGLILAVAAAVVLCRIWGPSAAARAAARAELAALTEPGRGQVWFAQVPFEEQAGSKDRPLLILELDESFVWGLYFTSQDQTGDRDYLPAPGSMWEDSKSSFLNVRRPIHVNRTSLRRRAAFAPEFFLEQVDEWADRNGMTRTRPRALPTPERRAS